MTPSTIAIYAFLLLACFYVAKYNFASEPLATSDIKPWLGGDSSTWAPKTPSKPG